MLDLATLRRANHQDAARMARLYLASQAANSTAASRSALDPQIVQRWLQKAAVHDEVWVLEQEHGRLVGLLALSGNELEALDVDPMVRRRGAGRLLLQHAKDRRPAGLRARLPQGPSDARAFLTALGFRSDARGRAGAEELTWRLSGRPGSTSAFRVVSVASGARA